MMFGVQCGNLSHTAARNFPNWGFFFGGPNWGGAGGGGGGLYALARFWFSVIISRMKNVLFRRGISAVCAGILCASSASAWGKSAKEVFAEVARSVVVVLALDSNGETSAQGSGVVVGKNQIVTNCHVIEDAAKVAVRQALESDIGQSYRMDAAILARDDERDLCLLFVGELSEPPAAPIVKMGAAKALSIGEEIFAIGAPKGLDLSLSRGIVSQLRKLGDRQTAPFVQTDAAVSPGSSGGGLFNDEGLLVGITTFKRVGGENLNFAIPAEWVGDLQEQGRKELAAEEKARKCLDNPDYECVIAAALSTARSIDAEIPHIRALSAIAVAQAKAGNKQEAQDAFAAALSTARRIDSAAYRAKILSAIAIAQAKAGNKQEAQDAFAAALSTAHRIDSAAYRAKILSAIAIAQAKAGNKQEAQDAFAAALSIARRIDSASGRAEVLSHIAIAQAKAGNKQEAQDTLAAVLSAVRNVDDTVFHVRTLGNLTAKQAAILSIARKIEYAMTMSAIAVAQAKAGNKQEAQDIFAAALSFAQRIDSASGRAESLSHIARAQAEAENKQDVQNAFVTRLDDIVETQAKEGNFRDAMKTAMKIEEDDARAEVLASIAKHLASRERN